MLELYHHGSSVCAAKVRLVLFEKGLKWQGHYIDILRGEQFQPEYLKLNPKAVVPTLIHNGCVIRESSIICEYIDDAFLQTAIRPGNPHDRAEMRYWPHLLDESLHRYCSVLTFISSHRYTVLQMSSEDIEAFLNNTVGEIYRRRKRQWVEMGFDAPEAVESVLGYHDALIKMEEVLAARPWLAGNHYSLADISMTPYVNRLEMLGFSGMWEDKPHLSAWFQRIKARPSFKLAVIDWIPQNLSSALAENGRRSWPKVRKIIEMFNNR